MSKVSTVFSTIKTPESIKPFDLRFLKQFEVLIERMKMDTEQSISTTKTFSSKIKELPAEINSAYKKFTDMKKTECKAYMKLKEQFSQKISKMNETARKVSISKKSSEYLEITLAKKYDARNRKYLKENEIELIKKEAENAKLDYETEEKNYDNFKMAFVQDLDDFNEKKLKFSRIFNAYSESIDGRMKDSLNLYLKRLSELLTNFSLCQVENAEIMEDIFDSEQLDTMVTQTISMVDSNGKLTPISKSPNSSEKNTQDLLDRLNRTDTMGPPPSVDPKRFVRNPNPSSQPQSITNQRHS